MPPQSSLRASTRAARPGSVLLAALCCGALGCGDAAPPPAAAADAHPEELLRRAAELVDLDNDFLAEPPLQRARRDALAAAGRPPTQRFGALLQASFQELRAGEETAAEARALEAVALLPRLPAETAAAVRVGALLALGVAHLRRGEVENCCARHTSDSCIMPIRGEGLHRNVAGSTATGSSI